jgi:hypothetical protein
MKWSEDNSVLTDAQFGFRPGYGTHDAISAILIFLLKKRISFLAYYSTI